MFPDEPMTQPKCPCAGGGEGSCRYTNGDERRGLLSPGRGGFLGLLWSVDSSPLGFTKPPAPFLDGTGLLAPSLEVSILTCWPDGKLRHVQSLGSTSKSQPMGSKSRACLLPGSVGWVPQLSEQDRPWWPQTLVARGLSTQQKSRAELGRGRGEGRESRLLPRYCGFPGASEWTTEQGA